MLFEFDLFQIFWNFYAAVFLARVRGLIALDFLVETMFKDVAAPVFFKLGLVVMFAVYPNGMLCRYCTCFAALLPPLPPSRICLLSRLFCC